MSVAVEPGSEHDHRHIVGFYNRDDELVAAVTLFLADAIEADGAAVVVATGEHRRALVAQLGAKGHDVEALTSAGRYQSLDADKMLAAFMVDDVPDAQRFAAAIGAVLGAAPSMGPVHVFGEMVSVLWDRGNVDAALELETLWNDVGAQTEFALFCAYAMSSLEASGDLTAAKRVCDTHTSLMSIAGDPAPSAMPLATRGRDIRERVFVATTSTLRSVRQFTRDVVRDCVDAKSRSELEVIASELATNAIAHARSPFRVSISCTPTAVRVAVRDTSFVPPEYVERHTDRVGGRGVWLVASFARAWGTREEVDGKTVWAEIARPPASSADR